MLNKNMLGNSQSAPTMATRVRRPTVSVASLSEDLDEHNDRMSRRVKPSDDHDIDLASWDKTLVDVSMDAHHRPCIYP